MDTPLRYAYMNDHMIKRGIYVQMPEIGESDVLEEIELAPDGRRL